MPTTFENDQEYRNLRREVVRKTRTAAVIGGIGSIALLGGGFLALEAFTGGLLSGGVLGGAAIAAVGAVVSYIGMKTGMEAQLDTQELDAMRSAKHLQMAFGDKGQDVSRDDVMKYEMMNRGRSDGKSWTQAEQDRSAPFDEVSR